MCVPQPAHVVRGHGRGRAIRPAQLVDRRVHGVVPPGPDHPRALLRHRARYYRGSPGRRMVCRRSCACMWRGRRGSTRGSRSSGSVGAVCAAWRQLERPGEALQQNDERRAAAAPFSVVWGASARGRSRQALAGPGLPGALTHFTRRDEPPAEPHLSRTLGAEDAARRTSPPMFRLLGWMAGIGPVEGRAMRGVC